MKHTHYVAPIINGKEVPSSAVKSGTAAECIAAARRLNAYALGHPSITYGVFPCVSSR